MPRSARKPRYGPQPMLKPEESARARPAEETGRSFAQRVDFVLAMKGARRVATCAARLAEGKKRVH